MRSDIWKNSAPHRINYKQLAIVCLTILRRQKIEEKFSWIKLKLIEWMKTEEIYCLFNVISMEFSAAKRFAGILKSAWSKGW